MTTKVENEIKTGDVVIVVKGWGAKPETTNVGRVTKSGQVVVFEDNGKGGARFKRSRWDKEGKYEAVCERYSAWRNARLYAYSDAQMNALTKEYEVNEARKAEKAAEQDRHNQERKERIAAELAEVKMACGGSLFGRVRMHDTLPEVGRLYIVYLPVKPACEERKGKTEVMVVRCQDINPERHWYDDGNKVEFAITMCSKSSGSFSSVSTQWAASDEEALWEAARSLYHSGG